MTEIREWVTGTPGFLTPLIALLAAYIAWQQYRVNRHSLRLDLYEKRFRVYAALRMLISAALANAAVTNAESQQFLVDTKEAEFLFKPKVGQYLTDVYRRANELHSLSTRLAGNELPVGVKRDELVTREREVLDWFGQQPAAAAKLFAPYLDFRKAK